MSRRRALAPLERSNSLGTIRLRRCLPSVGTRSWCKYGSRISRVEAKALRDRRRDDDACTVINAPNP